MEWNSFEIDAPWGYTEMGTGTERRVLTAVWEGN